MRSETCQYEQANLQKLLLSQNRKFLDAVRMKLPLEDILKQYDVVKSLFDTIQEKHINVRKGEA